ncbi:MAG TPA: metallophosphatase [Bacteroidales bacterium]|nr:metallophosphatase [Bacteroidales bacterium]
MKVNGRLIRLSLFITVLFCIFIASIATATQDSQIFHLVILHSNDFHGADFSALSRAATLIKQTRATEENVLYLNAGDLFTRGPYHRKFYGELEFSILNKIGCDALTLGNNEFKATRDRSALNYLTARISQADFPTLCANILEQKDRTYLPKVQPFCLKNIHGIRVGIMGVTTAKVASYRQTSELTVLNPIDSAEAVFPKVSSQSDIVLALTHIGVMNDLRLAERLPKLAAVIGGDSHSILFEPEKIHGVPVVQAGAQGIYLGRLDLYFESVQGQWQLMKYKGQLLPINKSISEDLEVNILIRSFIERLPKKAA